MYEASPGGEDLGLLAPAFAGNLVFPAPVLGLDEHSGKDTTARQASASF